MFVYVRYAPHTPETKTDVSLVYMLLTAAAIAALNTWVAPPPLQGHIVGVSWIAILLLVYSMVAAVSPGKMLAAALVAASFDPIGVWLAHLRGVPVAICPGDVSDFLAQLRVRRRCPRYRRVSCGRSVRKLRKARELGSYELVKLLGHGGMGEVWEAKHRLLARRAAVKLVRPEMLGASSEAEAKARHQAIRARSAGHSGPELAAHHSGVRLRQHRRWHRSITSWNCSWAATSNRWCANSDRFPRRGPAICCGRSATRWPTRTRAAWCTATSNPPTSTCAGWVSNTTS